MGAGSHHSGRLLKCYVGLHRCRHTAEVPRHRGETMSTQPAIYFRDLDLGDGNLRSLPCPSPEHEGKPGDHDILIQYAASVTSRGAPHGVWLLRCWTGQCSQKSIAEGLRIDLPEVRPGLADLLPHLAMVHDNEGGEARLAFHASWPEMHPGRPDSCSWPGCEHPTRHGHRHEAVRGTVRGTQVALWGEDTRETALVVVGGVEDAARLYRAGLHPGFMPVTWYEARPDSPGGSITDCDWSAVSGHEVVIWLDDDSAASGRVELVSRKVEAAGAASVQIVESSIPVGDDRDVLLSALESYRPAGIDAGSSAGRDDRGNREERSEVSRQESEPDHFTPEEEMISMSEAPEPNDRIVAEEAASRDGQDPVQDHHTTTCEEAQGAHPAPVRDGVSAVDDLLSTAPEACTDLGLAARFLRDHGNLLVGASDAIGDFMFSQGETGLLTIVDDDNLAVLLSRSQVRYLAEAREASPAGLSSVHVDHARLMGSERAPGLVRRSLWAAHIAMKDRGVPPQGYRQVSTDAVDADPKYMGAPNGIVDLSTGSLLEGQRAADAMVYRSIPDPYDPGATHSGLDALFAGIPAEDLEILLDALGCALLGMAGDRVHLVVGGAHDEVGQLLRLVQAALGRDYVAQVPKGALIERHPVTEISLRGPAAPRLLVGRVAARNSRLDMEAGVHLMLSDAIRSRALPTQARIGREATAVFLVVRRSLVKDGPGLEPALLTQCRVLRCVGAGGESDARLWDQVIGEPRARQALFARLVQKCVAGCGQTDSPTLSQYRRRPARRPESMTAEAWIGRRVIVTKEPGDTLGSTSLWRIACSDPRSGEDKESAWGLTQRRFTALVRTVLSLEPPTSIRESGEVIHGWRGVRLVSDGS